MKTVRFFILAASILFAGHIYSKTEFQSHDQLVPLEKAMFDFQLARAIYAQVNPGILNNKRKEYTALITYQHHTYIIYGKRETWELFFTMDPGSSPARPMGLQ